MPDFSRFNFTIFFIEAIFYVVSFIVAIVSTLQINKIIIGQAEIARRLAELTTNTDLVLPSDLQNIQQFNTPEVITISQFLIAFLVITIFFYILVKTKYGSKLIGFIFYVAIFSGAQVIFRVWMNQEMSIIFAFILAIARYAVPYVIMHDFALAIAITGIAINLGINITPNEAILILIAVSVYDFIAVYVTKHMVKMMRASISLGTIFAMIIPADLRNMFNKLSQVNKIKGAGEEKALETGFVYLGGGDLAFPLIMVIAALKVSLNSAVFTAAGALIGLLALNIIFTMQKERRPMAALPPLAVFSILGYLVSLIKF